MHKKQELYRYIYLIIQRITYLYKLEVYVYYYSDKDRTFFALSKTGLSLSQVSITLDRNKSTNSENTEIIAMISS